MKNTLKLIAMFLAVFATSIFAQEDTDTDQTAAVEETAAPEPKKEEAKREAPIAVGAKEDRPLGIRAGFHISAITTPKQSSSNPENNYPSVLGNGSYVGWDLGVLYDLMRIVDLELGGDAFQFRMLLEPGAFITSKGSVLSGTQYWLEVPVTAAFTLSLFGGLRVKYGLGPYVALGTLGTFSEEIGGVKYKQSRLDIGQWHTIGFEQRNFKNWWVDVYLTRGFMNAVSREVDGKSKNYEDNKPWAIKFVFGYNF